MRKSKNPEGLFYTIKGNGPALVLLHGFLEDKSMWNELTDHLSEFRTTIAIDLPGHGGLGTGDVVNIEDYGERIVECLADLDIDSFEIIGHSMGGYVALAIAEAYPKNVTKMVLLNSTPFADSDERKQKRQQAIGVIENNPQLFIKTVIPNLFTWSFRKSHPEIVNELIQKASRMKAKSIITATLAMKNRPGRTSVFNSFEKNGLIIAGREDNLVDVNQLVALSKEGNNQIEIINGGHMLAFESIDKVRIFLTNFIL